MSKKIRWFLGLLLYFSSFSPVLAQQDATITWTGGADSVWSNPENWNPSRVPLPSDHVAIQKSGARVELDIAATVASLRLGQASGGGTEMLVINGSGLTLNGQSLVSTRGRLEISNGAVNGPGLLRVDGALDWTAGTLAGKILIGSNGKMSMTKRCCKVTHFLAAFRSARPRTSLLRWSICGCKTSPEAVPPASSSLMAAVWMGESSW